MKLIDSTAEGARNIIYHDFYHGMSRKNKQALKKSIWLRDRYYVHSIEDYAIDCGVCKAPISVEESTIDHITPMKDGGSTYISNLQLVHWLCNMRKDAIPPKYKRNQ